MLEEIGVAFDVKTVDIRKGEQKDPAYLRLNPAGKVPTLTDGDVVVSENPAIAIYLGERLEMLPTTIEGRALSAKIVNDANDVLDELTLNGGSRLLAAQETRRER